MQSRRNFLKATLSLLLTAAGGAALWRLLPKTPHPQPAPEAVLTEGPEPLLSLFLLSDIHMTNSNASFADKLHMALKDITRFNSPVQRIVLGGDLVDGGREGDYKLLQEVLASIGMTRVAAGSVPAPVQGLYIQVYPDRALVRGREFSNRSWIEVADWRVDL